MPRYFDPLLKLLVRSSDQQLLAQVQFLKAENRILRSKLPKIVSLTHAERRRLVSLGKKLRWSVLRDLISVVHPQTFAKWVRRYGEPRPLRGYHERGPKVGRPPTPAHIREVVIRIARETGLGYTRIQGELNKLGIELSRSTITNILKGAGMSPDPTRGEGRWDEFLAMHAKTLWACDFFSVRAVTPRGVRQFYTLLFIHLASRRVCVTEPTMHPTRRWVAQQARNFTMERDEEGAGASHLIRDLDQKFSDEWDAILRAGGTLSVRLPRHSPNLNAFAERAIQTIKHECLNHFVIMGRRHLSYLLEEYVAFYNEKRPHSARDRLPPVRGPDPPPREGPIQVETRLGGLIKHYFRAAA